nr:hypothetical protein GCM10010200_035220 [Actinomadura rugatobispora]
MRMKLSQAAVCSEVGQRDVAFNEIVDSSSIRQAWPIVNQCSERPGRRKHRIRLAAGIEISMHRLRPVDAKR